MFIVKVGLDLVVSAGYYLWNYCSNFNKFDNFDTPFTEKAEVI